MIISPRGLTNLMNVEVVNNSEWALYVYGAGRCGDMKLAARTEPCAIVETRLTGRLGCPRQPLVTIVAASDFRSSSCEMLAADVHLDCAD